MLNFAKALGTMVLGVAIGMIVYDKFIKGKF